jgi:hypothetical protein
MFFLPDWASAPFLAQLGRPARPASAPARAPCASARPRSDRGHRVEAARRRPRTGGTPWPPPPHHASKSTEPRGRSSSLPFRISHAPAAAAAKPAVTAPLPPPSELRHRLSPPPLHPRPILHSHCSASLRSTPCSLQLSPSSR